MIDRLHVEDLYLSGLSCSEVGDIVGCTPSWVACIIKKAGINRIFTDNRKRRRWKQVEGLHYNHVEAET